MKTLLISTAFVLAGLSAFGQMQKTTPAPAQQSMGGGSQQQERTAPAQQATRTETYQQPVQQPMQQPAQATPAQQPQKPSYSNSKGTTTGTKDVNTDKVQKLDKKTPPVKDSVAAKKSGKGSTTKQQTEVKQIKQQQVVEHWRCPKCGRIYNKPGDYPDNGLCPEDGTALQRIN